RRTAMIDPTKISRDAAPTVPRQGTLSSTEAEAKRNEFNEAMRQDTEKNKDQTTSPRHEKGETDTPPPFSGDALLRGLGGSYTPLETQVEATSFAQDVSALATELAERILVNTDNRAADSEIRITLKDSVLPDTEIILRQEGERLVVQLVTGNPTSLDALRQAQENLRNKLLPLGRDTSVEVLDSRERKDGDGSGHSDRRSQGLDYFSTSEN
ncbi:MAG: hypothetical protein FWG74_09665, partial [Planctomycetes bacterium]|nr:hypothetical protein [Planctomycetota bacterium]